MFRALQQPAEDVFNEINPTTLNRELTSLMPGLSAKVFRTFNASITLENELKSLDISASKEEKVMGCLTMLVCVCRGRPRC